MPDISEGTNCTPIVLFLSVHCPLFPGKRYEDWELDDPAGQDIEAVRPIRDEIGERVRALLAELGVPVG